MEIAHLSQLNLDKTYSYADYLLWQFKERVELLRGKIFKMSPAPSSKHQIIVTSLCMEVAHFFRSKPCKVFIAPFDMRLLDKKKAKMAIKLFLRWFSLICV